jgi:hypothetical protein
MADDTHMHPVANGTWVCVPKTRARENHIEREEGKNEGMKEGHAPAHPRRGRASVMSVEMLMVQALRHASAGHFVVVVYIVV